MIPLAGRRIVLIEDDEIMGASLAQRLALEGADVVWRRQALRGLHAVRTPAAPVDAVVCDIRLRDGSGEEIFAELGRAMTPPPFLFITGQSGVEQAVRLLRAGAADYLAKPFEMAVFLERLARLMPQRAVPAAEPVLGPSRAAQAVEAQAAQAAADDAPVLLRGPRGAGKLALARRIHILSDRRAAPFVAAEAADRDASPDFPALGARTGEGVLFVAAAGRLSAAAQDALIALLREGPSWRLIAACGPRLTERVAAGGFRSDLYYLMAAREIVVPPLGDRSEDALWLARRLFDGLNARRAAPLAGLSGLAEDAVRAHDWPGGGRELRARMARAVEMAAGDRLYPADLFPERTATDDFLSLGEAREAAERVQIAAALARTGGQVAEAARLLRVSRTTLWEKMQKLGL
ncbi:sigma-54-dependent transcriptional regulator [Rubrimonas cliftonensis]|uniref:DNA-binding transcriptional response regulator, NtrC family, contains REC, AAA-type ATPase, and a Fis-type DNA-binding domains n=1 Tax=Rubrimonas cliftonensis TaxID=89524 RepID=A0A1H4F1X1_9RHOB|nr:response regulator [Rubrimonas cliftonensis]SEA90788.1 DNA-binding transcriptional response regulator, NtrC family, contains REC, AAA-type ATPase, and a Fis-type DNA-binding domains [Rubrimonas cliftonensis]